MDKSESAASSAWAYLTHLPPTTYAIVGVALAALAYVLIVNNKPNLSALAARK